MNGPDTGVGVAAPTATAHWWETVDGLLDYAERREARAREIGNDVARLQAQQAKHLRWARKRRRQAEELGGAR